MADVLICADSLDPADHAVVQTYSYGLGATYPTPNLINAAATGAVFPSNTRGGWKYNGNWYKLLNTLTVPGAFICKSTDSGVTWTVLDAANSPAFKTCSGYFDGTATVNCAFNTSNAGAGSIHLIDFDLVSETWGAVYGTSGAPSVAASDGIVIWKRPDATILVLYQSRSTFPPAAASGLGGVVYDIGAGTWGAGFDVGAALLGLTGWDSTQTFVQVDLATSVMGTGGVVHVFFPTTSVQTVPVFWGNRCFYQAINLDDSLGSFTDFPGQVAPLPPFPYNTQQLIAFSGSPMGQPILLPDQDIIVLPVLMRNDSIADRFPEQLANVYLGTPISAPVWSLDASATIDPGAIIDDFIWPQEAPACTFDGTTIYCLFTCQDEDGQNYARIRLAQTTTLASPGTGWTAVTAFDLQVDAPPGFNFATQELRVVSIFSPGASPTPTVTAAFRVALYGYKRFKERPVCAPDLQELPDVPPPKRVL